MWFLVKNRTFIIDSEHLQEIKDCLYGYMVTDDGNIYIDEIPDNISDAGLFCLVKRNDDWKYWWCKSVGLDEW